MLQDLLKYFTLAQENDHYLFTTMESALKDVNLEPFDGKLKRTKCIIIITAMVRVTFEDVSTAIFSNVSLIRGELYDFFRIDVCVLLHCILSFL